MFNGFQDQRAAHVSDKTLYSYILRHIKGVAFFGLSLLLFFYGKIYGIVSNKKIPQFLEELRNRYFVLAKNGFSMFLMLS